MIPEPPPATHVRPLRFWRGGLFILLLNVGISFGQSAATLPAHEAHHLDRALHYLNMTRVDLQFARDHGEPRSVLPTVQTLLHDPLKLPAESDALLRELEQTDVPTALLRRWLHGQQPADMSKGLSADPPGALDPALRQCLQQFLQDAAGAMAYHEKALSGMRMADQQALASDFAAACLDLDDNAEAEAILSEAGVETSQLKRLLSEQEDLDPGPAANRFLDRLDQLDHDALLEAGFRFYQATMTLSESLSTVQSWPAEPLTWATPLGPVMIGTVGPERYTNVAVLIIDPGGDDRYEGRAASVNSLHGESCAAVIDLDGKDTYRGHGLLGPGSALLGHCVILDHAGDDDYVAAHVGQASAFGGSAFLVDRSGNDRYRARTHAQASAIVGVAVLADHAGSDRYDLGVSGQAYAGHRGAALLLDRLGNDTYLAGGEEKDYGRHDDRCLTLAQGFSIGMRPFAGGGWAALVDLQGNDTYKADIYGQGVSYWYSVGMLLDRSGNDTYSMYHYGQGSGIHLSLGLLADFSGDDMYSGFVLAQGNAHDYAVGMLFDQAGNDTYTADHHSQGRALNNALGILIDSKGDDAYFGRQNEQCQGVGNTGGYRRYGSLGILCDLAGKDQYSSGASNDDVRLRPLYGIIYDQETQQP